MNKLPFVGSIFWKVFAVVVSLVVLTWFILARFELYERTTTDTVGSAISSVIFSYLVHLWLLPPEYMPGEDEESVDDSLDSPGDEN